MKFKILITLLLVVSVAGSVYADSNADQKMFNTLFAYDESKVEDLFHESFLKKVPAAKIIEILNYYKSNLGVLDEVKDSGDSYTLIFENGTVPARINLEQKEKITGLWFGNFALEKDNLEDILREFKEIPGDVSICILKNNQETILSYNEELPLAVGSSFKLYVLKAVYDTIRSSDKSWNDIIRINNRNKSLPTGILQNWPELTPVTVKTLTNLMMSISDNTATDHLIDYVGRDRIENYTGERNKPFLKTGELFKLKYAADSELQRDYIQSGFEGKRNILKEIKEIDLSKVNFINTPALISELEWFFSTRELSQLIYDLKEADEIKINSGLVDKEKWNLAGFKGGSEPGVLQYTHILQENKGDDIYAISITVNNTDEIVDENKVTELTVRLISSIESE